MTEVKSFEIGKGNKIVKIIDLDVPYARYEVNKLLKMDDMAQFIWEIEHEVLMNSEGLKSAKQVFSRIIQLLEERGLRSDDLTF
jgi:hypothetical protein